MAQSWTLAEIRAKVRKITGRPTTTQISDTDIDDYIDNYYLNILPLQTQSTVFDKFSSSSGFTGTTTAGTGEYALGSDVLGIKKPLIFDGEEIPLWHDLEAFLLKFPPDDTTQTKPTHGLIWGRELYLRPLPDDNDGSDYTFEAPKIDRPTTLASDSTQTVDELFGPALAYGASIDIFMDNGETEQAAEKVPILESYISLIFRKDVVADIGRSAIPSF